MNKGRLFASLTVLALLTCAPVVHAARPIRAMILDGESGGPYHAWRQTTPYPQRMLEDTGLFDADVVNRASARRRFQHLQARLGQVPGGRAEL